MYALVGVSANLEIAHRVTTTLNGVEKLEPAETTIVVAGSSVNTAMALIAFGWTTHVVAAVGRKGFGNADIKRALHREGARVTLLPVREYTPIATNLFSGARRNMIPSKPPVDRMASSRMLSQLRAWGKKREIPVVRIFTGVRPDEVPLIQRILPADGGHTTVLSPNRALIEQGMLGAIPARILILGSEEMEKFLATVQQRGRHALTATALRLFFAAFPALELVVLTKGKNGAIAVTRGGIVVEEPAVRVTEKQRIDTTGCGDVFLATLLAYLYTRRGALQLNATHLTRAMRAAAGAASLKLQRMGGSSVPTRKEVEAVLGA